MVKNAHERGPGDEHGAGTPRSPWVDWPDQHPSAAILFFALGALIAATFGVGAVREIAHGRDGASLIATTAFWILAVVANLSGVLRAVRTLRDPEGQAVRRAERRAQLLDQPRARLVRQAATFLALVCAVPTALGGVLIVGSDGGSLIGWLLVILGVGLGGFFLVLVRRRSR